MTNNDLIGQRFGRLVVTGRAGSLLDGRSTWYCDCDCGKTRVIKAGRQLTVGDAKSCGCLKQEKDAARRTHGQTRVGPEKKEARMHYIWRAMIARCHRTTATDYARYGGRGITVCDRWRTSYENFVADMGDVPDGYSIDRIDSNKGYYPENCRWIPLGEQARNRRNNTMLTYQGQTRCMSEWAELLNLDKTTIRYRLKQGWSVEKALSTPPKKLGGKLDNSHRQPKAN